MSHQKILVCPWCASKGMLSDEANRNQKCYDCKFYAMKDEKRCEQPTPETVEACTCCKHTVKVPENLKSAVALFTGARTLPHVFIVKMELGDGTTVTQAMNRHQIEALPELVAKITLSMDTRNTRLKVQPEEIQSMYKALA